MDNLDLVLEPVYKKSKIVEIEITENEKNSLKNLYKIILTGLIDSVRLIDEGKLSSLEISIPTTEYDVSLITSAMFRHTGIYLACFTSEIEDVSMWRLYANQYSGYCLEYSVKGTLGIKHKVYKNDLNGSLNAFIYDEVDTYFRPVIYDEYQLLQEAQKIADNDPVHLFAINKSIRGRVLSNGALMFIEQLLHLAIVYKNKKWKNESEWRHVILTKRSSNHQLNQFLGYTRQNYLYIKLPLPKILYFSNFSNHLFNAVIKQKSKNIELAYYPCTYSY